MEQETELTHPAAAIGLRLHLLAPTRNRLVGPTFECSVCSRIEAQRSRYERMSGPAEDHPMFVRQSVFAEVLPPAQQGLPSATEQQPEPQQQVAWDTGALPKRFSRRLRATAIKMRNARKQRENRCHPDLGKSGFLCKHAYEFHSLCNCRVPGAKGQSLPASVTQWAPGP